MGLMSVRFNRGNSRGELIAVKQNSLLLLERELGADVTVDVDDIIIISIVKKSKVFKGIATGFFIGGGVGAVIGVVGASTELSSIEENPTTGALFIALYGVALGLSEPSLEEFLVRPQEKKKQSK